MSSESMTLDTATIVGIGMEAILYGLSVLMFMGTIWSLTYKNKLSEVNRPMTIVAFILLTLSTAHMVVNVIRAIEGLVTYRNTYPGGPVAFFADITEITFVIKNVIYALQTLVGDGVVIYRCYVVWRSAWVVILPCLLWLGVGITAVGAFYSNSHSNETGNIFVGATAQWITIFFPLTLVTNVLGSGLLAYRIWRIKRNVSTITTSKGPKLPILRVLVDAAILYSVSILCALVCFLYQNNGQYVLLDMLMPIMSISFYMIFIRLAISTRRHHSLLDICNCVVGAGSGSGSGMTTGHGNGHGNGNLSLPSCQKALEVHISQFTRVDADLGSLSMSLDHSQDQDQDQDQELNLDQDPNQNQNQLDRDQDKNQDQDQDQDQDRDQDEKRGSIIAMRSAENPNNEKISKN